MDEGRCFHLICSRERVAMISFVISATNFSRHRYVGWLLHSQQGRLQKLRQDRHSMRRIDLAEMQLASSETARIINRDIVLELIRASQPISRADLARRSGLGRSTVSQIVEQLIGENWVREGAMGSLPRGRRPTMVGLNEDLVAIAVDIHPKAGQRRVSRPERAAALTFAHSANLRSRRLHAIDHRLHAPDATNCPWQIDQGYRH